MSVVALLLASLAVAPQPGPEEDSKVRVAIDGLGRAMAGGDPEKILACFDLPRMIRELDAQSGRPFLPEDEPGREGLLRRLKLALPAMAAGPAAFGAPWEKVRTLGVKIRPDGKEAEALCFVTVGGDRFKFRFFLVREKEEWRVFDFEMLELGIRISLTLGSLKGDGADEKDEGGRKVKRALGGILRAVRLISEAEFGKARETLAGARSEGLPGTLGAWIETLDAIALVALEEYESAIRAADRALAAHKDLALAHFLKAGAFTEMGKDDTAIASAREFMRLVGDDPDAWSMIGGSFERLEQRERAIEAYRKGAACDDEDYDCRFALGRLLVDEGRIAEAKPFLLAASRNAPTDELTSLEAAHFLGNAGEYGAILELVEERLKRTPDESDILVWQGRALRRLSRFEDAERALRVSLKSDPEDFGLMEELVLTLAQAGKDREAMESLETLEKDNREHAGFARVFVHALAGRTGKALPELKGLLEEDEDLVERIEIEPALKSFRGEKEVRSLVDPARATVEFMKAVRKLSKGDDGALLRLSKERLAVAPDHDYAHYYQGCALRRLKRFEEAVQALRAAVTKGKEPQSFRDELGRALSAVGNLDDALFEVDQLLSESKAKEYGMSLRVAVYAIAKKPDEALRALEELLTEFPNWQSVIRWDPDLAELRQLPACQTLLEKARKEK